MKISYSWLSTYIDLSPWQVDRVAEMLTEIGLEVEGVEKVESIPGGLVGVKVGEVTACESHPNADRLKVTKVNVGEEELQIVCGAPNVAAGQKVAVASVGTTLHFSDGKSLKIKKGKIRGEESAGMICAEDELGISDDHDGIMVLDASAEPGRPLSDYIEVSTDYIIDIDLTPNRADALCHLGVAEDLAAYINTNEDQKVVVKMPSTLAIPEVKKGNSLDFDVEVRATDLCPRYAGVLISGIEVGPSSRAIADRLKSIGLRPINNVVDITQFILHEMGQPLHAFDYDEIGDHRIVVDTLPAGTSFRTLEEDELELTGEEIMICDGTGQALCMGGVFGGSDSGVTSKTTRVFIESAYFDAQTIRKASMHHQLRTDAAKVYEKGADPNRIIEALSRAVELILTEAGGTVASAVFDSQPEGVAKAEVELNYDKLAKYLGVSLPAKEVKAICEELNMEIIADDSDSVRLRIPSNKPDVLREVDVIEEVIRIYGLDNIPVPDQAKLPLIASDFPGVYDYRNKISFILNGAGLHEAMSLSLVHSAIYEDFGGTSDLILVNNSSNRQLDALRKEMYSSLLQNCERNYNRQDRNIRLFEFGKTFCLNGEGAHQEEEHLCLGMMGHRSAPSRFQNDEDNMGFFDIKAEAERVFKILGVSGYQTTEVYDHDYLSYGIRWHRGPQVLAEVGKIKPQFTSVKLDQEVFAADIHWAKCLAAVKGKDVLFSSLGKYPSVERDLALVVDEAVTFDEIRRVIFKVEKKWVREVILFDHYTHEEQLGAGKKSYAIRLILQSADKTLKDKNVDKVIQKMVTTLEKKVGAHLR